MQVTILGASGRIGSLVFANAQAAGHEVVVLRRRASEADPTGVRTVRGNITDHDAVRRAIVGSAAVIAAVGPRTNSLEDELELERGMRNIVAVMDALGITRLIALSGAAVDVPGDAKPLLDRVASRIVLLAVRHVVGAKQREFDVFSASDLAWTALRPPMVTDGPARGYRLSEILRRGARVTRADVAAAMVDQIGDESFLRNAPFVLPR